MHEVVDVDGMAKTRPLANGIEIKPGKTVELKPGALRIVLLGLKEPFQLGQKIKGTLVFEKAGPVEIVYNVEENPGAAVSGVAGAQHKHHLGCGFARPLRAGLVSNASFSSQDPDLCPVRTKRQRPPQPACHRHRNESGRPGRSQPR